MDGSPAIRWTGGVVPAAAAASASLAEDPGRCGFSGHDEFFQEKSYFFSCCWGFFFSSSVPRILRSISLRSIFCSLIAF